MTKTPSYGIIETIGGVFMARNYRHIQQYEKEMHELREQGMTVKLFELYPAFSGKRLIIVPQQGLSYHLSPLRRFTMIDIAMNTATDTSDSINPSISHGVVYSRRMLWLPAFSGRPRKRRFAL